MQYVSYLVNASYRMRGRSPGINAHNLDKLRMRGSSLACASVLVWPGQLPDHASLRAKGVILIDRTKHVVFPLWHHRIAGQCMLFAENASALNITNTKRQARPPRSHVPKLNSSPQSKLYHRQPQLYAQTGDNVKHGSGRFYVQS